MELLFTNYLAEFITVLTITILSIITPGPDFIVVVRNSLSYSKRSGIYTSLGVASAIWIHILYTLAGIGYILSKSIIIFTILKYMGAAYLIYLGYSCLKSKKFDSNSYDDIKTKNTISDFTSFKMGFINNALNPKATLFFLSLFTQIVSPQTPLSIQVFYGATVSISCVVWFTLVSIFLNQKKIRTAFESIQYYFEKLMGVVLISLGINVAFASR